MRSVDPPHLGEVGAFQMGRCGLVVECSPGARMVRAWIPAGVAPLDVGLRTPAEQLPKKTIHAEKTMRIKSNHPVWKVSPLRVACGVQVVAVVFLS